MNPWLQQHKHLIEIQRLQLSPDGWTLNTFVGCPLIATITAPNGKRKTAYFGFPNWESAQAFKTKMKAYGYGSSIKLRRGQRLSTPVEAKVWDCPTDLIKTLVIRVRLAQLR